MDKKYELVYKSATSPFFPSFLVGGCFCTDFHKIGGKNLKPKNEIVVIKDGTVNWFFEKSLEASARNVYKSIFSSSRYLKNNKRKEVEISRKILKEIKTRPEKMFKDGALTKEGEKKLRKVFNLSMDYADYIDAPGFLFQVYLTEDFKKEIWKYLDGTDEEKEEKINLFLSTREFTNYERFLFDLLKIAKGKKAANPRKIAKKYFWLFHDYLGEIIDEKYVMGKIKELKNGHGKLAARHEEAKKRIADITRETGKLPEKIKKKVKTIQEILYLYSERKKEVMNQANYFIRKAFEYKFPKKRISGLRRMFQITPDEAIDILKSKTFAGSAFGEEKVFIINDKKIKRGDKKFMSLVAVNEELRELKGSPASPGKIKGRVSLVFNTSHIGKFKKGEILVAPYTSVNYLPIMHEAKAILTETGGLTSHAAIVSRELKKPCIVGIKHLFAALKDGDMVEVDAAKGIVKILK